MLALTRASTTGRFALAAAFFVIFLPACPSSEDDSSMCRGESAGATVQNSVSGQALPVDCLEYGALGNPSSPVKVRHIVQIILESGVWVSISFPGDAGEGMMTISASGDSIARASLEDGGGFEGSPRDLCTGGASGTFRLDRFAVDPATGMLTSADGEASITFSQCTSEALGITNADLALDVKF